MTHPSRSDVQQQAEPLAIAEVSAIVGVALTPRRIDMGDGVSVEIDGASADGSVLVEVSAHVGPLRGAQPRKLASDAFKLVWAGKRLGSTRLVIAVVDDGPAAYLRRPKAWLTAALLDSRVEVLQVSLPALVHAGIAEAQTKQFR